VLKYCLTESSSADIHHLLRNKNLSEIEEYRTNLSSNLRQSNGKHARRLLIFSHKIIWTYKLDSRAIGGYLVPYLNCCEIDCGTLEGYFGFVHRIGTELSGHYIEN
jgi:hypothetical protein